MSSPSSKLSSQNECKICRADGVQPYNEYLWPTESWWAREYLDDRVNSCWHFGIVALSDGRFSTEGTVWSIEKNNYAGQQCVFMTRKEAIRVAAARMIRKARASKRWPDSGLGGLKGKYLAEVINWARSVCAKETDQEEPKPIQVKEPPPVRRKTGFPLLDFIPQNGDY